jgi:hypothetical protein
MPNWCSNYISVRGPKQEAVQRLADAFDAGEFCHAVIPCPDELNREGSSSHGGPNAELYDQIRAENKAKYGYDNWYDFNVDNWGTKWDITIGSECDRSEDGLGFSGSFDTAWAPPMGVVQELVAQGYEVTLYYYESGMGFVGKFEDGVDDYYDIGGLNSSTVAATIGNELDDFFGISESMREYEEENEQEELTAWYEEGVEKRGLEPHIGG